MHRSRHAEALLIGLLAAAAMFCALQAGAAETHSIVAQSGSSTAATGRRPLAQRIAAASLPIQTESKQRSPAGDPPSPELPIATVEPLDAPPAGRLAGVRPAAVPTTGPQPGPEPGPSAVPVEASLVRPPVAEAAANADSEPDTIDAVVVPSPTVEAEGVADASGDMAPEADTGSESVAATMASADPATENPGPEDLGMDEAGSDDPADPRAPRRRFAAWQEAPLEDPNSALAAGDDHREHDSASATEAGSTDAQQPPAAGLRGLLLRRVKVALAGIPRPLDPRAARGRDGGPRDAAAPQAGDPPAALPARTESSGHPVAAAAGTPPRLEFDVRESRSLIGEGEQLVMRIDVRNVGGLPAEAVTATLFFAEGVEPVQSIGHAAQMYPGEVRFAAVDSLAPGAGLHLLVTAVGTKPGSVTYRGELECRQLAGRLAREGAIVVDPRQAAAPAGGPITR